MTDLKLNPTEPRPDEKSDKPATPCTNVQPTLRKIDSAPSNTTTDPDKKHRQIPVDLVEEESMESFPASDPPSHHHSSTSRREPRRPGQPD
jgi:hypothetical protein